MTQRDLNSILTNHRWRCVIGLVLCLVLVGCEQEKPIKTQRIHKHRSGLSSLRKSDQRMLVGMFEQESKTWFFKLLGDQEKVSGKESEFLEFLNQVEFDGDQPKWDLPEGWSDGGKRPMRHATLLIPAEFGDALELSISFLGPDQNLVENANRWLGQLSLPPVTDDSLTTVLKEKQTGKQTYQLFDATGSGSGKMTPGSPPFAQASPQPPPPEVKYQPMEGWDAGKTNSIVKLRLTRSTENGDGLITVVKMPAVTNEWVPNVQRWCDQVSIELDAKQIKSKTEKITIDQLDGQLVRLIQGVESKQRIIGAMVKKGPDAWFVKLMGDEKLVTLEAEAFVEFCKSLKFP